MVGASLVAQWWRICLPAQETLAWSLGQKDATCRRAAKPVRHNHLAYALEPGKHNYRAVWELVLRKRRSYHSEKPAPCNEEWPLLTATWEKPTCSNKDPAQPKINTIKKMCIYWILYNGIIIQPLKRMK